MSEPPALPMPAWAAPERLPGGITLCLRGGVEPDEALRLRAALSDPARWDDLELIADGRRAMVVRLRAATRALFVKRYSHPNAFVLRTVWRRSRAEREAEALDLIRAALPDNAVVPLAWAEQRVAGFVPRCWLATLELEDAFDLRRLKELAPEACAGALEVLERELPARIAALHAAGVFLASLRGKNILLQPASGRVALIDMPYARRTRITLRHRRYDLACLSLELRHTLAPERWAALLAAYVAAAGLAPRDALGLHPAAVAAEAERVDHRTPLRASINSLKRAFRHSRVGQWVTGHRYPEERP